MYESLALLQEATGADKQEIQRTLLSAADVVSDSPDAQYRVARRLARHGLKEAAIRLYREASEKVPLAPEPYLESLDLAAELVDGRTVAWAASHLLAHGWVNVQDELHKKARSQAADVENKLRRAGRTSEADALVEQVRRADTRDLVVRIGWQGDADIDLRVVEPPGTVCCAQNRVTGAGGVLVRDSFGKDAGSAKNTAELYVCARALPGDYEIRVDRVWGSPLGGRVKVEVTYHEGSPDEKHDTFYVPLGATKPLLVKLETGRRTGLLAIPQYVPPGVGVASSGRLPIQELMGLSDRTSAGDPGGRAGPYGGPQHLFQFGGAVGGGAVAFNPTITPFFFGAGFTAQAVISADRRYVRLNVFPQFNSLAGERRFQVTGAAGGGFGQ